MSATTLNTRSVDPIGVQASGDNSSSEIISTHLVNLISDHSDEIGQLFYSKLFKANPKFAYIFAQPSSQAAVKGHPRQFVLAFIHYANHVAKGIWDVDEDDEVIEALVQKHRALMTESSYYPQIGASFIDACSEVLKLNSKEIADLTTVYSTFAEYLVKQALVIDTMNAQAEGGWTGYRTMRVAERYMETPEVVTLTLKPLIDDKNQEIVMPDPGQYLGVSIKMDSGVEYRKQYFISNVITEDTQFYQISIQKMPGGVVSKYLYDNVRIGDHLDISPPGGNFTLRSADNQLKPCVMICAGIGAIPMKSLAHKAVAEHHLKTLFIQCDRTTKSQLFGQFFKRLQGNEKFNYRLFLSQQTTKIPSSGTAGRLTQNYLEQLLPVVNTQPNIYVCGPLYFMLDVRRWLENLGYSKNIYYEYFGPQVM